MFSFLKECEEFQFQAKCFVPCLQDNNGRRKCSKFAKKEKEKRMQIEELLFRLQMYLFISLIYYVSAN